MEISTALRKRFCKDCGVHIDIFQEPYFSDRIKLFDKFYGTIMKWNRFVEELENYDCEQDYFEEYNHVKEAAITSIKTSEAYQRFNSEDIGRFAITHRDFPTSDIFKPTNDGRIFISIDMKKANFSSLRSYDADIFGGAVTWSGFISHFTNNGHIRDSKYIRQVILGTCNPRRHITYEKWIMDQTLTKLELKYGHDLSERIVFFSNDEIVYDVTGFGMKLAGDLRDTLLFYLNTHSTVPFRVELFKLHKINGANGYYKEIRKYSNGIKKDDEVRFDFKCLDSFVMPFVLRKFLGEEVTENDKVFYNNGLLAKFIEVPEIEVDF